MYGWSEREARGRNLDSILSVLEAIKDRNVMICWVMNGLKNVRSGSWKISWETIARQWMIVAEIGVVTVEMEGPGHIEVYANVSLLWP